MVASTASVHSRKRKATTDMPDSPPKRVTRARAKAIAEANPGIKVTKITTASGRIAAEKNISAKPAAVATRRLRTTEQKLETDQHTGIPDDIDNRASKTPKSGVRSKKIIGPLDYQVVEANAVQRTRSRMGNKRLADEGSEPSIEESKIGSKSSEDMHGKEQKAPQTRPAVQNVAKRTTRARTAIDRSSATTSTVLKASALRKKVTFDETPQEDKENTVLLPGNSGKAQPKSTGMKAKPVRKASTAKENVGGKGGPRSQKIKAGTLGFDEITQPLSPKKVTQVAKSSSISSEDELCGDKSPLRTLRKSPVKPPMSTSRMQQSTISTVDLNLELKSPTKLASSSILSSPARRPPPSPFKDILKVSPRKISFEASIAVPAQSQSQNLYTIKASPRKTNLSSGTAIPYLDHSQTPLKTSLLQSPARRPIPLSLSPVKPTNVTSQSHLPADVKVTNTFKLPVFTSSQFVNSPLRASKDKATPVKVHLLVSDEEVGRTCIAADCSEKEPLEQERTKMEDSIEFSPIVAKEKDAVEGEIAVDVLPESKLQHDVLRSQCTTPPGEPSYDAINLFNQAANDFRCMAEESDSEDELQSTHHTTNKSPLTIADMHHFESRRADGSASIALATSSSDAMGSSSRQRRLQSYYGHRNNSPSKIVDYSMTPLALQLSSWLASSPDHIATKHDLNETRIVSSPSIGTRVNESNEGHLVQMSSPMKSTLFDDEMLVRDQEAATSTVEKLGTECKNQGIIVPQRQQSEDPEEFGDENAVPIDPQLFGPQYTPLPKLETWNPTRVFQPNPREIHTVSKVPLRPAGDESSVILRHLRSQSFSETSVMALDGTRPIISRNNTVISYSLGDDDDKDLELSYYMEPSQAFADLSSATEATLTPINKPLSNFATPTRTPRVGLDAQTMRGAVVFVDVHTTEGADASGIFIELLTQMGAKCVKQWSWNPRVTTNQKTDKVCSTQSGPLNEVNSLGKVGITHVVYKDGGKRTLEKVRESKGLVLCVGVGWVLE